MSDLDKRISQFETMAQGDPDNDMAHFSLGQAYLQAGRHQEAADSLLRCLELNPEMSKAYQLAGHALIELGQNDEARPILEKGYVIAAGRGELPPKHAMEDLLRSIGCEPPDVAPEKVGQTSGLGGSGSFVCSRTGRAGTQLPEPPFRGPIGRWIQEKIAAETWQAWIGQGTKVINELRLDLSRDRDAEIYDEHMCEFLGIDDQLKSQLTQ